MKRQGSKSEGLRPCRSNHFVRYLKKYLGGCDTFHTKINLNREQIVTLCWNRTTGARNHLLLWASLHGQKLQWYRTVPRSIFLLLPISWLFYLSTNVLLVSKSQNNQLRVSDNPLGHRRDDQEISWAWTPKSTKVHSFQVFFPQNPNVHLVFQGIELSLAGLPTLCRKWPIHSPFPRWIVIVVFWSLGAKNTRIKRVDKIGVPRVLPEGSFRSTFRQRCTMCLVRLVGQQWRPSVLLFLHDIHWVPNFNQRLNQEPVPICKQSWCSVLDSVTVEQETLPLEPHLRQMLPLEPWFRWYLKKQNQATHCLDLESETSSSDHIDHIQGQDETHCPAWRYKTTMHLAFQPFCEVLDSI